MNNLLGISPEELLRSKELMGGLEYDPIIPPQINQTPIKEILEPKEEIKESPVAEEPKKK